MSNSIDKWYDTRVLFLWRDSVHDRRGNAAYLYECAYGCGGGQQEVGGFLSSLSFSRDPGEPFPSGTGTNIRRFEYILYLFCPNIFYTWKFVTHFLFTSRGLKIITNQLLQDIQHIQSIWFFLLFRNS